MSNEQGCSLLIAHCSLFLAANFGHTAIKRDNILIKFMSPQFPPNRFGDGSPERMGVSRSTSFSRNRHNRKRPFAFNRLCLRQAQATAIPK